MSHVEDRWAIEALIYEYSYNIDEGDFEAHSAMFEDAEISIVDPLTGALTSHNRGAEEHLRHLRETVHTYENGGLRTKHVTTNLTIEVSEDGTTASARSYITVLQGIPNRLPLQPIFSGRYEDSFVKRDGRWRFKERKIFADFVGEIGLHSSGVPSTVGDSA